ncbi:MAG: isocitrate/isopropylmalate dehydrogenase [Anaerolineales bacterium]|jgi:3-isopropylmalate dehydrogenase|nr:isocitrate/isopropylmalate dehydrogenase [Anaerolineales bacterium]MBM2849691.1 isocitrate/isopropylmalate dehydrogenase [Anaerolineales bacterium]
MKTYNIGVIGGDGIGPEVVREGLKVLQVVKEGFDYNFIEYPYSSEHYLKTKELVPDKVIDEWRALDAVFLGAIGHPAVEVGLVERSVIMGLRFGLDLYVNLRPVKLYAEHICPLKDKKPADVDFVVARENTEDAYAGVGGIFKKGQPDEVAIAEMVFTRRGTERIIRYAFELARERAKVRGASGRKPKLTMVDKANAIRAQDLWTRVFEEVGKEYPDVEQDHAYVDACCMWMVKNPDWFDVIVTTNLFGDIITDLGAMIQGGMGIAASGNIHPGKHGMFEPIHGSAPKYAGQNVANPLGAIAAAGMMLDFLGEKCAAERVESVVVALLTSRRIPSVDAKSGLTTVQIGDMVTREIAECR